MREGDGLVKIGKSDNSENRVMSHKSANGMTHVLAVCPGDTLEESGIHARLRHHRVGRGREWYQDGPEVQAEVEAMRRMAVSAGWPLPVRCPVPLDGLRTNYRLCSDLGLGPSGRDDLARLALESPSMAIQLHNGHGFPVFGIRWFASDGQVRIAHLRLMLRDANDRMDAARRDVEACETALARASRP